jgi:hypothetical protein
MSFFGNLFSTNFDKEKVKLLNTLTSCEQDLKAIQSATNYKNALTKFNNVVSNVKSVRSRILTLQTKFKQIVEKKNVSSKLPANVATVYISRNGPKYRVIRTPPIKNMQGIIDRLKSAGNMNNANAKKQRNNAAAVAKQAQNEAAAKKRAEEANAKRIRNEANAKKRANDAAAAAAKKKADEAASKNREGIELQKLKFKSTSLLSNITAAKKNINNSSPISANRNNNISQVIKNQLGVKNNGDFGYDNLIRRQAAANDKN